MTSPGRARRRLLVAAFVVLHAIAAVGQPTREQAAKGERADDAAFAALARMRRGVNVLGFDGFWKGETDAPFRMIDFGLIRRAGFDHVRINFFGFTHMDSGGRIDPAVLARLDKAIDEAALAGLTPVLDQHANELCQSAPDKCKAKLVAFWRQISARYAGKHPRLIFEILNEPGGSMTHAVWNATLLAALAAIRAHDPTRIVIAAALNAGDARDIEKLELPEADRGLIVTAHYYEPFRFTHQGAPWSDFPTLRNVAWGSPEARAKVVEDLTLARDWAQKHGRPVYLGEFGVYDKAPIKSRAAWVQHVARTAESFGWAWAYWQFDHDFAVFDSNTHTWNQPILDALMR